MWFPGHIHPTRACISVMPDRHGIIQARNPRWHKLFLDILIPSSNQLSNLPEPVSVLRRVVACVLQGTNDLLEPLIGHPLMEPIRCTIKNIVQYWFQTPKLFGMKSLHGAHEQPYPNEAKELSHGKLLSLDVCIGFHQNDVRNELFGKNKRNIPGIDIPSNVTPQTFVKKALVSTPPFCFL